MVLYEADGEGLGAAVVGMLANATEWAWRFSIYDRHGFGAVEQDLRAEPATRRMRASPSRKLPPIKVMDADADADTNADG